MSVTSAQQNIVMIVHGIGEQQPGETIDRLTGAATHRLGLHGKVSGHTELLVEPDNGDGSPSERRRQMRLFPCAIRRVTIPGDVPAPNRPNSEQEILAAEVYWADLSSASQGVLPIAQDLLHTVLALGYLALDNVEYASRNSVIAKWLVNAFVVLFHGLIAPANALMLAGSIAMILTDFALPVQADAPKVSPLSLDAGFRITLALWASMLAVGTWRCRNLVSEENSRLARDFWRGFAALSAVMLIWTTGAWAWTGSGGGNGNCLFDLVAEGLVWMMVGAWGFSLVLLIAMLAHAVIVFLCEKSGSSSGLVALMRRPKRNILDDVTKWQGSREAIHIPICCTMLILWTVLSASFWAAFALGVSALPNMSLGGSLFTTVFEANVERATQTLMLVLLGMFVLAGASAFVGWRRHRCRERFSDHDPRLSVWLGRAILNPFVAGMLYLIVLWVGGAPIMALQAIIGELDKNSNGHGGLAMTAAALLGLLLLFLHKSVGNGLGVVRDITSYSIRAISLQREQPVYPVRQRMEQRFDTVLEYLCQQMPNATRLIVIAHSQGTMIAALSLENLTRKNIPTERHFVTMGSPLGHIYRQYFPKGFLIKNLPGQLASWHNIYRCDDFVGTLIDGIGKVENLCLPAGGHVNYWTDEKAWDAAPGWIGKRA